MIPQNILQLAAIPRPDWLESWASPEVWRDIVPYLIAVVILVIGWTAGSVLRRTVEQIARRTGSEHAAIVSGKAVFYGIFLLAIFGALGQLGVELKGLLAAAGILTVAISFAAQTSVSNVISGIFLLFDRPFSINDTIKVDQTLGTVIGIGLLSSRVRTFDNLVVRIPNETLLKATITNYSLYSVRRVEILVTVEYDADLGAIGDLLLGALRQNPLLLDEPEPVVLTERLGERGIELVVRAWCVTTDYIRARSELNSTIAEALAESDVTIPFPQQVIHLRND